VFCASSQPLANRRIGSLFAETYATTRERLLNSPRRAGLRQAGTVRGRVAVAPPLGYHHGLRPSWSHRHRKMDCPTIWPRCIGHGRSDCNGRCRLRRIRVNLRRVVRGTCAADRCAKTHSASTRFCRMNDIHKALNKCGLLIENCRTLSCQRMSIKYGIGAYLPDACRRRRRRIFCRPSPIQWERSLNRDAGHDAVSDQDVVLHSNARWYPELIVNHLHDRAQWS